MQNTFFFTLKMMRRFFRYTNIWREGQGTMRFFTANKPKFTTKFMINALISSTIVWKFCDFQLCSQKVLQCIQFHDATSTSIPFYRPDVFAFLDLCGHSARNGISLFKLNFLLFSRVDFLWSFQLSSSPSLAYVRTRGEWKISRNSTRESELQTTKKIIYIEMRKIPRSINQKPIKLLAYLCKNKKLSCQSTRWSERGRERWRRCCKWKNK